MPATAISSSGSSALLLPHSSCLTPVYRFKCRDYILTLFWQLSIPQGRGEPYG